MNQAGHIFTKDARHLRLEIGISLVLTAVYLWAAPSEWRPVDFRQSFGITLNDIQKLLAGILTLLVPVSWWLLITRAVQDENLVGDTQWWVTKPYEWGNLLGGKLLFLAAFVLAPIFIVKCVLLAVGGFSPLASLPGLAASLALLVTFIVLPLMAVAAVTSTFARATLTLLGICVALLILSAVVAFALAFGGFAVPWIGRLIVAIILAVGSAAIVLQYARRMAWTARLVMIGAVVLAAAALALSGNSLFVALTYPHASTPVQIALRTPQSGTGGPVGQFAGAGRIGVPVPLQVSGLADGMGINVDAVKVTAEAPDGRRWTSPWESVWGPMYRAGADPSTMPFLPLQMGRNFFDAEQSHPVTLHLRLAVTEMRVGQIAQVAMPAHEFSVPGFGICVPSSADLTGNFTNLSCRAALHQPVRTLVQVQWSDDPCESGPGTGKTIAEDWAGIPSPDPAEFGLNAIDQVNLSLSNGYVNETTEHGTRSHQRYLCPASPITFTPWHMARRFEYDLTLTGYQMQQITPPAAGTHVVVRP